MLLAGTLSHGGEETGQKINVTAEVDKEQINIGDRIKLDVIVEDPSGLEFLFQEKPETLGDFSFIESHSFKRGWGKGSKVGREYVLGIYTTGTHVIPPVQLRYRLPGESEWQIAESPQVPIEVMSTLSGEETDIKDLKGMLDTGSRFVYFMFIIAALVYGGIMLWIMWRKRLARLKEPPEIIIRPAYEIAHEQLIELKNMDLPGKGRIKEYYIRLSDIVRHYLENRFTYRAPEMTTEEFLEYLKISPEMREEHKELLKEFLFHCDMVKFAKYGPTPLEMLDSYSSAEKLVEQTKIEQEELEEAVEK